jgi:uncharacterized protein involved in type VI secretion and phage assembly
MNDADQPLWARRGNEYGLALATVDNVDDPRSLGRIKVKFELKRDGNGNAIVSDWLQCASPFAGGDYGMFFQPQPGASALVAFSGSDPARAYIIGFLWNGKLRPPVEKAQQKDVRVIKTKGGKKITIDDSEAGGVRITDEKGNELQIDSENNGINIKCNGGTKISLSNDGGVSIQSNSDVSISALGRMSIKAENISIEAESAMTLRAPNISLN